MYSLLYYPCILAQLQPAVKHFFLCPTPLDIFIYKYFLNFLIIFLFLPAGLLHFENQRSMICIVL